MANNNSRSESYEKAGVDITAGYRAVELMKKHISRTITPGAMPSIGNFGGLFAPDLAGMSEPILVSGTDGVGTKLKLAFLSDKHNTVGIDCVAMCVNDIICCGAKPLFFLDYIACGKNYPEKIADIVKGVAEGCLQSDAALIGGETAEHPGLMPEEEYDLAGFAVGIVDEKDMITGQDLKAGDVLIGVASSGVHSNGFSLVRKIFEMAANGSSMAKIAQTLSDEKILIPSAYEEQHGSKAAQCHSYHDPYRWNTTTITYILDRQEYLGHTVLRKSIRENFKLKKRRAATPEEQIIFRDTHEAIIDQETWDKAQRLRKRCPKRLPDGTYTHRLSGIVFCADCGSRMSFSSPEAKHRDSGVVYDSDSSWQCSKYRNMYVSCTSHFIKTSTIEAAILEAIKTMTGKVLEDEAEFAEQLRALWESQNNQSSNEFKKELLAVQKRMDELDTLIRSLYESSVMGKIPERQFQRLMAQYDEEQTGCETRMAELKKELDNTETTKVDLKRFIKLIRKYKDCEILTDDMLYELVEKVVIHSASGGRTIYRQQQIDIYFNFIGDTFPSQIEINHDDAKKITEQQIAKRKKYQKTSGENRKKKRVALREAAKTDPQAAAEYEALLQKNRERCRQYAQKKKLAQQELADKAALQFEPTDELKGESA